MTHFTVTVKINSERLARHQGNVNSALAELLAPFCEHENDGNSKQYFQFLDDEDEYLREYETETSSCVRLASGEVVSKYDPKYGFRIRSSIGWSSNDRYEYPPGAVELEVPHKERYSSFEAFVGDWHGTKARDPEKNRYGHYANPNAKWDWYCVGGRWTGHFPVVPDARVRVTQPRDKWDAIPKVGYSDVVTAVNIDWEKVDSDHAREMEKYFAEYEELIAGKEFDGFDGPRSRALDIGLLRIEQGPYPSPKAHEVVLPWSRYENLRGTERFEWNDVATRVSYDEFRAKYGACLHPLKTYAALDDDGWHAPGAMGWFGCSSDTPNQYLEFAEWLHGAFFERYQSTDTLVIVDCHI